MEPGSIADTVAHLALWAGRPTRGLARVEYHSEYTRAEASRRLGEIASREKIPYHEIQLPSRRSPSEALRTLLQSLASLEPGIVSITGLATACADAARAGFLRALTFNRENLAEFNLRQIWWMTPDFADAFIRTVPALDSWFILRLRLRETFTPPTKGPSRREAFHSEGPSYRLDDALRRARSLVERFRRAKEIGAQPSALTELAAQAAEAIVEIEAPYQARELADRLVVEAHGLLADALFDSPATARFLNSLATLLATQGRQTEAEPLYRRALATDEASLGPDHPNVAIRLNNLASLLQDTNRLTEAEPLYRRALAIDEASYGSDHPNVATGLNNLAELLHDTNRLTEAEPLYRRAKEIYQASYGPDHPNVATGLNNLAWLLKDTNRLTEAEPLYRRALAIDEASYGPDHPKVANRLDNLAELLRASNRLTEAEPLYRRALAIDEASLDPNHPNVAIRLNNLAMLLKATNRLTEAEPLYRRALAIKEASYGPDHPNVATGLNNLAALLQGTNRLTEAEPLFRRALEILHQFTRATGHEHPHHKDVINNYAALLAAMGHPPEQIRSRLDEIDRPSGRSFGGSEKAIR